MKKKDIKAKYNKEEKRHDAAYEKENTKHEKKHKIELEKALKINSDEAFKSKCSKKKKKK